MAISRPRVIEIFDRDRVRQNRNRAAQEFPAHDFLFTWAGDHLLDRLRDIKREFPLALQAGARAGASFAEGLKGNGGVRDIVYMDLAESFLKERPPALQADEEFLPFADNVFDLVVSPLSLHTVNDLPGALIQINRVLKPDGVCLGAMLGGKTLMELRQVLMQTEIRLRGGASPHVAPFADKQQIGALMQRARFALPVVDSETVTATYETLGKLLDDIRGMGEGNGLKERGATLGKSFLAEAEALYRERFADPDGRIRATFEVIFLIGWAPHGSQPKPLRPGSATKRLSEALGTKEIGSGVRTDED